MVRFSDSVRINLKFEFKDLYTDQTFVNIVHEYLNDRNWFVGLDTREYILTRNTCLKNIIKIQRWWRKIYHSY